jgi:predicted TIM-barrel fold metal-dependent hydrolase
VYTHLGKRFAADVRANGEWQRRLRRLAARPGWFAPASEILDFLGSQRRETVIPPAERRALERRWMFERLRTRWTSGRGRRR